MSRTFRRYSKDVYRPQYEYTAGYLYFHKSRRPLPKGDSKPYTTRFILRDGTSIYHRRCDYCSGGRKHSTYRAQPIINQADVTSAVFHQIGPTMRNRFTVD